MQEGRQHAIYTQSVEDVRAQLVATTPWYLLSAEQVEALRADPEWLEVQR